MKTPHEASTAAHGPLGEPSNHRATIWHCVHAAPVAALLALVALATAAPATAASRREKAIRETARSLVASLPDSLDGERLAITGFTGDARRELAFAVAEVLREQRPRVLLVEKAEVQRLFEEQGWQASDMVDAEKRVRLGQLEGARFILFGEVIEDRSVFLGNRFRARAQLDDVQSGLVEIQGEVGAESLSGLRPLGLLIALAILAIAALWYYVRAKIRHGKKARIDKDRSVRERVVYAIREAARSLGDARDRLTRADKRGEAQVVREAEMELDQLRLHVEKAAAGSPDHDRRGEIVAMVELDHEMEEWARALAAHATELANRAADAQHAAVLQAAEVLRAHIRNATNRFETRRVH